MWNECFFFFSTEQIASLKERVSDSYYSFSRCCFPYAYEFFFIKLTFFIDTRLKASFSYLVSLCGQGFYYCKIYEIFLVLIRFSNLSKCYIAQVALIILCKY